MAKRNDRRDSQSRSISASSSFRMAESLTCNLAALTCSDRMTSTVVLNVGCESVTVVIPRAAAIDSDLGEDFPGLVKGEEYCVNLEKTPPGDIVPGVSDAVLSRFNASAAALRRRLVVPSALVLPERAEHTITIFCWSKYSLVIFSRSGERSVGEGEQNVRDNVFCNLHRKLPYTRTPILLDQPLRRGIDVILVHVGRGAWALGRKGRSTRGRWGRGRRRSRHD